MITEFYDVVLVDFSGLLPFKLEKEDILTRQEQVSSHNLYFFLSELEKNLGESFVYFGSDLLETRLFHRVLLKDGLLELLIGTPVTLLAHYKEPSNAEKFKDSLQKTLKKTLPKHLVPLVENSIEIKKIEKKFDSVDAINNNVGFKKLGRIS